MVATTGAAGAATRLYLATRSWTVTWGRVVSTLTCWAGSLTTSALQQSDWQLLWKKGPAWPRGVSPRSKRIPATAARGGGTRDIVGTLSVGDCCGPLRPARKHAPAPPFSHRPSRLAASSVTAAAPPELPARGRLFQRLLA